MPDWEILLLFFSIAILYSSVGFGGGSSYLAILALFGVEFLLLRSSALLCNIVVVTGGTFIFYKNGYLDLKKVTPLVMSSLPMAFLGGYLPITESYFFILLGITLFIASLFMWLQSNSRNASVLPNEKKLNHSLNIGLGGGIGFLAGIVGIGGGIFLAPVLNLLKWDLPKKIAATASFFILINSIAGLAGQMARPSFQLDWDFVLPLIIAVFLGGQIGSRLGAVKFSQTLIKKTTALLICFVAIRISLKYLS